MSRALSNSRPTVEGFRVNEIEISELAADVDCAGDHRRLRLQLVLP